MIAWRDILKYRQSKVSFRRYKVDYEYNKTNKNFGSFTAK